jgi:hypothetical protein
VDVTRAQGASLRTERALNCRLIWGMRVEAVFGRRWDQTRSERYGRHRDCGFLSSCLGGHALRLLPGIHLPGYGRLIPKPFGLSSTWIAPEIFPPASISISP